jgi:hypothetical protein
MKMLACVTKNYVVEAEPLQTLRKDGFINVVDKVFLQNYSTESLEDLVAREHLNQYVNLVPKNIHRLTRAEAIDRLFAGSCQAKMEDKSVVFQAIGMFDRYLIKKY